MSLDALDWAYSQEVLSSSKKSVLAALAYHANVETRLAYPTIETLVHETELDRKTIIAALKELTGERWITDTERRTGRTKSVKVYLLHHVQAVPKTEPLAQEVVEKQSVSGPVSSPRSGGEAVPEAVPKTGHRTGNREPETETEKEKGGQPRLSSSELILRQDELKEVRKALERQNERASNSNFYGTPTPEIQQKLDSLAQRELELLDILGMSPLLAKARPPKSNKNSNVVPLPIASKPEEQSEAKPEVTPEQVKDYLTKLREVAK